MNDVCFACSGVSFDDQLHSCQLVFEVQLCMRLRNQLMFMIKKMIEWNYLDHFI